MSAGARHRAEIDGFESDGSDRFYWDRELPGFGRRMRTSGSKFFVSQFRTNGRLRRIILEPVTAFALDGARRRAAVLLPDARTGARVVPIFGATMNVLFPLPRPEDNPLVFVGGKPSAHLTDFQHPWRRIRDSADLDDVRIHDLRVWFASRAFVLGEGLPMIGDLLGHRMVNTTARYAHLARDSVRHATANVGDDLGQREQVRPRKRSGPDPPSVDMRMSPHSSRWTCFATLRRPGSALGAPKPSRRVDRAWPVFRRDRYRQPRPE